MRIKLDIKVEVDNDQEARIALLNALDSAKDHLDTTGGNIYSSGPIYAGGKLVGSFDLDLLRR